jgi:hypothetical protein
MSDVPATAWLLLAVCFALVGRRGPREGQSGGLAPRRYGRTRAEYVAAGACAGMAVLTRPALLTAALALLCVIAWRRVGRRQREGGLVTADGSQREPERASGVDVWWFAAALGAFLCVQGGLNTVMYGSPWSSGYGMAAHMFSAARVAYNTLSFTRWLTYSHTALFWVAWAVALLALRPRSWPVALSVIALAVALPYLPYLTFDDWEASRFLLPGIALGIVVGARGLDTLARALGPQARAALLLVLALASAVASHRFLDRHHTFELWRGESKYPIVGGWIDDHTPGRAVILAGLHSGSIEYYAGRQTVRWDEIPPGSLVASVRSLTGAGHPVYLALDAPSEGQRFASRFREDLTRIIQIPGAQLAQATIFELRAPEE